MAYTLPDDPEIFDLCIVRNGCYSVSCAVVQQVQRGSHFRIDVICCDIVCFEVLGAGVE